MNLITRYDGLKDFQSLYQNIDLGIIVSSNGVIEQANDYFETYMKKLIPDYDQINILDLKIFLRMKKAPNNSLTDSTENEEKFSLNEFISRSQDFMGSSYFKICLN